MRTMKFVFFVMASLLLGCTSLQNAPARRQARTIGPEKGWLILEGGGRLSSDTEAVQRFRTLAGGAAGRLVLIPTAWMEDLSADRIERWRIQASENTGISNVVVLHTLDRLVADTEKFVLPLRAA